MNKAAGMTSHDVVDVIRRITGERRVGHAGTLDPFATGVLVVGVGREATKTLGWITKETEKRYTATLRFGATSDTYDREGMMTELEDVKPLKKSEIQQVIRKYTGNIKQIPPAYSAIKIGGKKSYDLARKGEAVALAAREVTIHSLTIRSFAWPLLVIDVTCSSGTYIRSLAHDIGRTLGCGAYLEALERTAVGSYTLSMAHTLEGLENDWEGSLLPIPKPKPPLSAS